MKGIIYDIKRFAVHDGPGIRSTVFFKGCPLSCIWCHNPESQSQSIEHLEEQHKLDGQIFGYQRQNGREISASELLAELEKDRVFMEESGGGITLSGGEPLMQAGFLREVLRQLKQSGFHTALDTCGFANPKLFQEIAVLPDLILYDLKLMDPVPHKKYTAVGNDPILKNLKYLHETGKKSWIRIPIVEGITDTENNIQEILNFLDEIRQIVAQVNLLPYHDTAKHKYKKFGKEYALKDLTAMSKDDLHGLKSRFEKAGFQTKIGG